MGSSDKKKTIMIAVGLLLIGVGVMTFVKKSGHSTFQGTGESQTQTATPASIHGPSAGEQAKDAVEVGSEEANPNAVHEVVVDDSEVSDGEVKPVAGKAVPSGMIATGSKGAVIGVGGGVGGAGGTVANGALKGGLAKDGQVGQAGQLRKIGSAVSGSPNAAIGANQTPTVGSDGSLLNGPLNGNTIEGSMAAKMAGETVKTEVPKTDISKSCFTVTYTHKDLASHRSGEACTHHRNLIKLPYEGVNARSICMRVNGTPVKFLQVKGKPQEVVIGPIAGPTAKITARFCMNKATCAETCVVPKDEFMDAIGGTFDETGDNVKVAQWDPSDHGDSDAAAEIDPEVKRELANQTDLSLFSGWINETEVPACGTKTVMN